MPVCESVMSFLEFLFLNANVKCNFDLKKKKKLLKINFYLDIPHVNITFLYNSLLLCLLLLLTFARQDILDEHPGSSGGLMVSKLG